MMASLRDHTSLLAWQEARAVASGVLDLSESHWKPALGAAWGQLQKCSLSVQLNIAEGYALGTTPSFNKHLRIAYGSAVETGEVLEHLSERLRPVPSKLLEIKQRCERSQRLLLGLLHRRHA
jgi:four helix bundle protein